MAYLINIENIAKKYFAINILRNIIAIWIFSHISSLECDDDIFFCINDCVYHINIVSILLEI